MRTRRDVLALGVAGVLGLAGCARERAGDSVPEDAVPYGAEAGEPIDDVLDRWRARRDDNRPFGLSATTTLSGDGLVVHSGDGVHTATVEGSCTVRQDSIHDGGLVCSDVTVDGAAAAALFVNADRFAVTGGALRGLHVDRAWCHDPVVLLVKDESPTHGPSEPSVPDDVEGSGPGLTEYAGGPLEAVELSGFEEAFAIRDGERVDLEAPVTVTADHAWLANDTKVEAGAATLRTGRFSVAAPEGTSGTVAVEGRADVADPHGLFGADATLAVEPGRLAAEEPFRLTQAVLEDRFALESTVDVLPATTSVSVPAGETRWVDVYYRERSYVGDGVVGEVSVDSEAEGLVTLPVEPPEPVVTQVVESLDDGTATSGLLITAFAPALAALVVGEGVATFFNCAVNDCPSERPYPSWIHAGAVDRFYYRVDATDHEPGTYEATARVEGANYDTVEIPVEVTVTEATGTPTD